MPKQAINPFGKNRTFLNIDSILYKKEIPASAQKSKKKTKDNRRQTNLQNQLTE
jgi:hypothetical protein